jgi:DNA-binding Lrp family transcriptional regulator
MADDLDRKIIRALNQNARKSFREVAKEVGTSVTAVINRVKKFESKNVIRGYIPVVDPEYFGLGMAALIALRIAQGKLMQAQKEISKDSRILGVYDITGEWDSIILGYFRDREDLNDFLKDLLSKKYIARSVTHIVLNVVKEEKRLPI